MTEKIQKVIKCNDNSVELGHHHHYTDPTIECGRLNDFVQLNSP